jgi:NAD-dependent deacetylase
VTPAFTTGTALLVGGDLRGAIASLRQAVHESPQDPAAHHNLAVALRAHGDVSGALHHAHAAGGGAPTQALLGSLLLLQGNPEGARAAFRAGVAANHAVSRYYLGLLEGDPELIAQAAEGLPGLLRERALGQLSEVQAGGRLSSDLCAVPLVSELFGPASEPPPVRSGAVSHARRIGLTEAAELLKRSRRTVALTGAGLSLASGLATRKQLWERHSRDAAVSIWRFREEPTVLWSVIADFLGEGGHVPNTAHRALAQMGLAGLITQNVDGLHQAAGTACEVVELHGTLLATRCDGCGAPSGPCADFLGGPLPPRCACGGLLRPDVVLFGEWVAPDRLARATALASTCEVLLVAGSAMDVSPAADLPRLAAAAGATVIEVKHAPSRLHQALGTCHLPGAAETLLPRLVELLA